MEINALRIDFRKSIKKSIISELTEKPKYKLAKLNDCGGDVSPKREWYFYFYILQPNGKYKRFIERFDINRKRGRTDDETRRIRYDYAKVVIKQINNSLTEGTLTERRSELIDHMTVERAIIYAMELKRSKGLRLRSIQTYQNAADRFIEYADSKKILTKRINDVTKKDIQAYADYIANSRQIGNLSKNKYITHLRTIFTELLDREIISQNPCSNMGKLREEVGEKNIPLSVDELNFIREHLPGKHPRLWMFSLFIYYGMMRGEEICHIKAGMIDFHNGLIHLPASVGKTNETRIVKLMPDFVEYLRKNGVDKYPSYYFLFSKTKTLEPGEKPIIRNRVSELWKEYVKDGLGMHKDMYALKHTSAKIFMLNGGSIEALQAQMGHKSITTTEIYIKRITPQESLNRFYREFQSGIL